LSKSAFREMTSAIVAHITRCAPSLGPVESLTGGMQAGAKVAAGGIAGFSTGVIALAIPGIGPLIAAGPLAAELLAGGAGAAIGGRAVLNSLKHEGVSEEDAGCYCEAVRRGGILVTVNASEEKTEAAERIIGEHQLVDIEDCAAEWREKGWRGFDPTPEPAQDTKAALPFDPERIRPGARAERRRRRAVRSYVRVT
jgi:hypothetical protein